jgi:hypothetical protein
MIYRRLDANGDRVFGGNQNDFLSGREAVAQSIFTRLRLLKEEFWEDQDDGLPLFQTILGSFGPGGNKKIADSLIQKRIIETPEVTEITEFQSEFVPATRSYTFQCLVNTQYGTIPVTSESLLPAL